VEELWAWWDASGGHERFVTTYFDGFENYNGNIYYKKYSTVLENGLLTSYSNYILYREGNDGNFYYINPDTGIEQIDFENNQFINAQIGDPFNLFFQHQIDDCPITNINIINIGGLVLKYCQNMIGEFTGTAQGIGNVGNICLPSLDGGGGLACYTKQGQTFQFSSKNCNSFPTANRQNLNSNNYNLQNVTIYPNPTNDFINIDLGYNFKDFEINLYDLQGRLLFKIISQSKLIPIDLSNHQNGTYFIKIKNIEGQKTLKILKN
jgi:Secretion system C-terminal sorting domain